MHKEHTFHIKRDVPLALHTTIQIGGPARFFVKASTADDIQRSIHAAREKSVPLFVLAGGSNVLFLDEGYPGLVMVVAAGEYRIEGNRITAWAGVDLQDLVDASIERGLKGLEWAGGLPGSVGGAVRGNAGAFGGEIKDNLVWVRAISLESGEERIFSNNECSFAYRESIFKKCPQWCIAEALLELEEGGNSTTSRAEADDHIRYRRENHPQEPNAGSMFKNVVVDDPLALPEELSSASSIAKYGKIGAGVLIDRAGLKGERIGGAEISQKHANHIVNRGGATAADVVALLERAEKAVYKRYGIALEREVYIVA